MKRPLLLAPASGCRTTARGLVAAGLIIGSAAVALAGGSGERMPNHHPLASGRDEARPTVALAMWVWETKAATSPAQRDRLLAFCRTQRVSALYLNAYHFSPSEREQYRHFLRAAHRQGLGVHALAGDPRWALARYHQLPLAWVEQVVAFNQAGRPDERFDGIHTDIEPYLLTRAWTEHPAQLLGGLLDLHAKIADLTVPHRPLQLGADAPFWFDDDASYTIEWRGRVLPPSHHLLDVTDYVTVLAYRNYADGTEGVIQLSQREVDYAQQIGKQVVIGQETQADLFPAYITYGGTSAGYFWGELAKLVRMFHGRPSFWGIAVHHYESFRSLVG